MKYTILAIAACLVSGCVTKTEFQPYQKDVRRLLVATDQIDKRLADVEDKVNQSLEAVRGDQADIKADLIDVRTEIQTLRGEWSSGTHERDVEGRDRRSMEESVVLQLSNLQQRMQMTEARLARIEEYFGLKPLASTPAAGRRASKPASVTAAPGGGQKTAAVSSPPPQKALSAEDAYEMAYHLFKANENEAARKAFDQFVRRFPDSPLVDNALFWTGETYYRTEDYANAILKYQQVVKKYPKGSKGPDALLKMGYALEKMKELQAAAAAMEKLLKAYPKAPQAKLAARKLEQLKSAMAKSKKAKGG